MGMWPHSPWGTGMQQTRPRVGRQPCAGGHLRVRMARGHVWQLYACPGVDFCSCPSPRGGPTTHGPSCCSPVWLSDASGPSHAFCPSFWGFTPVL